MNFIFDLALFGYLAYKNGVRAKLKAQNVPMWVIVTLVSMFAAYFIGFVFVAFTFCLGGVSVQQLNTVDIKTRQELAMQIAQTFSNNPLHLLTVQLFGLGGYFLNRYLLERMPDKKEPDVHWMDKMNDTNQ